jgi:hypothetical protein
VLLVGASACQASTIIKLDLGGVGPDVQFSGGPFGILETVDATPPGLTGDQATTILFTDFLAGLGSTTGSYSLNNLTAVGAPTPLGGGVLAQNFAGGNFQIFDSANVLLLDVNLATSLLVGGSTGAEFSIANGTVVGGLPALTSQLVPNSIGYSLALTNISGGGLTSVQNESLAAFTADGVKEITATQVPEPTTMLVLAGLVWIPMRRSR